MLNDFLSHMDYIILIFAVIVIYRMLGEPLSNRV
jgi:hypothetical protein